MARLTLLLPMFLSLLLAFFVVEIESYSRTTYAPYPGDFPRKVTHFHFYFHDTVTGNNLTVVTVAKGPNTNSSAISFGKVSVADDPLTVGPERTSEEVGRAQGIYASADQKTLGLLMALNFAFTKGIFNGSSVAMFGRNPISSKVREMSIIGGTGAFRFGRGYAQAKTYVFNRTSNNAIVEYNVYVWH